MKLTWILMAAIALGSLVCTEQIFGKEDIASAPAAGSGLVGKWYGTRSIDEVLVISEKKGEFHIKGNFNHIFGKGGSGKLTDVHMEDGRLLFKRDGRLRELSIEDGLLVVRYERSGEAMQTFSRTEDPEQAAERKAERQERTGAFLAGLVGAVQTANEGMERNAEIRQAAQQERAAAAQQMEEQRQQAAAFRAQQQQVTEAMEQQRAEAQRAREQRAADLRLQAQAAAAEKAAQQAKQAHTMQQQIAPQPAPTPAQPTAVRYNQPQPAPSAPPAPPKGNPQEQPVPTRASLSDLTIADVQLHDPNPIDGGVCYVSYTLFNKSNLRVSITVDVDVVSRGLESQARYEDGLGPNMSYTYTHSENIQCRPADAD